MSRSTQYIGLTAKATAFITALPKLEEKNTTLGMFDEEVPLGVWQSPLLGKLVETLQVSPWSGGPLLFTCLSIKYDGGETSIFQWIADPTLQDHQEFDYESGAYWV